MIENISMEIILGSCNEILADFMRITHESSPYEVKGIFNSELLMLCATLKILDIDFFVESGRARGQSTEILARYCRDNNIEFHSIEFDRDSPDVKIAEKRLIDLSNHVELHYGDAFSILPKILNSNSGKRSALLVDGPKGPYAIELAMVSMRNFDSLLGCFFHDVHRDAYLARDILDKHFSDAIYSEDETFVKAFQELDQKCWDSQSQYEQFGDWGPYRRGKEKMKSYSSTLGFIHRPQSFSTIDAAIADSIKAQKSVGSLYFRIVSRLKKIKRML